jgi:hypothetical protein
VKTWILAVTISTAALAQPPENTAPEQARIDQLEHQIEVLNEDLARTRAEVHRNEQLLLDELGPRNPVGPYTPAVRNAIRDLSDVEQQLISGNLNDVEERLARAQDVLGGRAGWGVWIARTALESGDLADARGYINHAIRDAEEIY